MFVRYINKYIPYELLARCPFLPDLFVKSHKFNICSDGAAL